MAISRNPKTSVELLKKLFENELKIYSGKDDEALFFEEFKKQFGEVIGERAISDLKFIINKENQGLFDLDFSFVTDNEAKMNLIISEREALRCLYGLNRDGKDFYEFVRFSIIIIEQLLLFYVKINSDKIKYNREEVVFSTIDSKQFDYKFYSLKERPNLQSLLAIFFRNKFSQVLQRSQNENGYKYVNGLNHLKGIRDTASHNGFAISDKYWPDEIKNFDFFYVQQYVKDVNDFVKA